MAHHLNIVDIVANAALRGVVYQGERRLFHGMSNVEMAVIGAVIIGVIWAVMRRPRSRRW
ncbi:hypothetical protein [Paraburkholderia youngii]|uniref:hypothetical protein n=1 Tax=Paraburkholderia youngii TaxID=2782701 RepID=UPI003D25EB80